MRKSKRQLDLGGTACYSDPSGDSIGISLDNTSADDYDTPRIVGDYNHAPFPANTFKHAEGSCYFESTYDLRELYRICAPGADIRLCSCETFDPNDLEQLQDMFHRITQIVADAIAAGFEITVNASDFGSLIGFPYINLVKPKGGK